MSEPFLGEIRIFSFGFAPRGWAACNGQIMSIPQNSALFSLLGVMYGGNGVQNFALPNLQGRVPFHIGSGYPQGQSAGEVAHTLITAEMPQHAHTPPAASSVASNATNPVGNFWANGSKNNYNTAGNATMAPLSSIGGSQPHDNMSPYLALNFCIALMGIYPTRS